MIAYRGGKLVVYCDWGWEWSPLIGTPEGDTLQGTSLPDGFLSVGAYAGMTGPHACRGHREVAGRDRGRPPSAAHLPVA